MPVSCDRKSAIKELIPLGQANYVLGETQPHIPSRKNEDELFPGAGWSLLLAQILRKWIGSLQLQIKPVGPSSVHHLNSQLPDLSIPQSTLPLKSYDSVSPFCSSHLYYVYQSPSSFSQFFLLSYSGLGPSPGPSTPTCLTSPA